ncbi:Type 4 prepilin-like proteins leader peptide-processing enzyme [Candidatus Izimaplasma bacterium HR1]|jgi:leader peptidase (prepilin peptidase)/N-methyltransferase|uniref:prepilin peptidase n=1 Tax=Candidatus Izimoplasma sp. HR1 TaxID=1541959 RepID=UPI0004F63851|nr:Type 4 prepilin-like proteins leader peptide-processing enzyme [Candidatus Izimaplasma bacterium HR1]
MIMAWAIYLFFIGLFFGSFYNVVGIRVPQKETLLGRSHCPNCNKTLGWLELFPIIGYIVLKGKCKNCKTPISVKYPIMELITGVLFSVSFVILHENVVEYILVVVFISLMVIVTVSDMYYQIVPNIILLVFLPVIFGLRMFSSEIIWYYSILGGVLGFCFMYFLAWYGKKRFKREALGGGDIKLYFLIGLFLGVETVFLSLLFAAILGLIYSVVFRKKSGYLPFVPFIAVGSMIAYYYGPMFLDWYMGLIF